jgi:hypothetical protein
MTIKVLVLENIDAKAARQFSAEKYQVEQLAASLKRILLVK